MKEQDLSGQLQCTSQAKHLHTYMVINDVGCNQDTHTLHHVTNDMCKCCTHINILVVMITMTVAIPAIWNSYMRMQVAIASLMENKSESARTATCIQNLQVLTGQRAPCIAMYHVSPIPW